MALAFLVLVLLLFAPVAISQQDFLSIDCGLDANYSGYKDKITGIVYVSDGPYIDAGENHRVAPEFESLWWYRYITLRSFPSGQRNCYALPTVAGTKYLLRVEFAYGNYDGKNSSWLEFDLHLGANLWDTVNTGATSRRYVMMEGIFVAWAGWAPLCLVNTGHGTPFVSVLELRPLGAALYPLVTPGLIIYTYNRLNMGGSLSTTRYPDDQYDRLWWAMNNDANPRWVSASTTWPIQAGNGDYIAVPSRVLQSAVAASSNDTALTAITWQSNTRSDSFMVFLHFADFQNTRLRQFDIYINQNDPPGLERKLYTPLYLTSSYLFAQNYSATNGNYNITLAATNASELPPMINALEIYKRVPYETPTTLASDFDAIMAIKIEYGVKKNWMGDPCFPTKYTWDGVKCSNGSGNTSRITSLDLSNSSLHGTISKNFTLFTALENLDLSYNNLSGSIPDSLPSLASLRVLNVSGNQLSDESLCKNYTGPLIFRRDFDVSVCNKPSPSPSRNKVAIIAISIVVPVLVVIVLILAYFIWWEKRKQNVQPVPIHGPTRDPEPDNTSGSKQSHGDNLNKTENRRFTYKELDTFTNNFKKLIGQGGFGSVYYGHLEDNTEVAVKMRSESSSRGLDEFLAEVPNFSDLEKLKVHNQLENNTFSGSCCVGSELDKGASQESSDFDWLLLGETSFGTSL